MLVVIIIMYEITVHGYRNKEKTISITNNFFMKSLNCYYSFDWFTKIKLFAASIVYKLANKSLCFPNQLFIYSCPWRINAEETLLEIIEYCIHWYKHEYTHTRTHMKSTQAIIIAESNSYYYFVIV